MKIMSEAEVVAAVKELALQVAADSDNITSIVCAYALKGNDAHSVIVGKNDLLPKLVCLLGGAVSMDLAEHSIDIGERDN
jgi:hypothetical protein